MLHHLSDPDRRVLIVKAGTGTGKSTYMPYKLLDPPDDAFRLTDLGPIIVTEPRVQATVGVATFVGREMSGTGGVGPGYPVGFQVKGNRQHDSACQLIYVTDGTVINWLREGRLSSIGTLIVDEAHERSTNIDFILGFLHRELDRYPHLRVIITSATFDAEFYRQYFGANRTNVLEIPAVKTIGYGWPLFSELDAPPAGQQALAAWSRMAPELRLAPGPGPSDSENLIASSWPRYADPLGPDDVVDPRDIGYTEDLHATTRALFGMRARTSIPVKAWKEDMPAAVAEFVVALTSDMDEAGIYGDILAFLPTTRAIEEACAIVTANLADLVDVYPLIASLPTPEKEAALAGRRKGDRRKIVISTNLAETSLTVEGVRFVVDSGLIAQSEWDVITAQGDVRTKSHSQSGIKQRWGRVGRKAPGWVFPLYSKDQLLTLDEDTSPGATRSNLEDLVMTAKLGGLGSVYDIVWPAAFEPEPPVMQDAAARTARSVFIRELARAQTALHANGALDDAGDPTSFGKELSRLQVLGSASAAMAIMYADRLACLPEVATILTLLQGTGRVWLVSTRGMLLSDHTWPDEWRLEAAERHRALASACEDDAELVLQVVAAWERADPATPPWEPSSTRAAWAAQWWVNHDTLLAAATVRRDILGGLSPVLSEEVKRFVEPSLLRRARGAITRAFAHLEHTFDGTAFTPAAADPDPDPADADPEMGAKPRPQIDRSIDLDMDADLSDEELADLVAVVEAADVVESGDRAALSPGKDGVGPIRVHGNTVTTPPACSIPLNRSRYAGTTYLSNFVTAEAWAHGTRGVAGPAAAVELLVASARDGMVERHRNLVGLLWAAWPAGTRALMRFSPAPHIVVAAVNARHNPPPLPAAAEELAELDAAHAEAHGGGTVTDAAPELDTSWPSPNVPVPDTDAVARTAVLDHRDIEGAEYACGTCLPCLDGNLHQCTDRRDTRIDWAPPFVGIVDENSNLVAALRAGTAINADVTSPAVVPDPDTVLEDDTWYEIYAYTRPEFNQPPAILLRTDWRTPDHVWGPAQHPDLTAGNHIEVRVGGVVRDHHGDLRVFTRTDGRGRFLLREATPDAGTQAKFAQLAISLGERDTGQLADLVPGATLVATALPRSHVDHFTITFLDLAAAHLQNAPGAGRAGKDTPAVVEAAHPNGKFVEVHLLATDTTIGLRHRLSGSLNGTPPPEPGTPVLIDVRRATPRLPLQGRPLVELHHLLDTVTGVRLAGLPTGRPLPPVGTSMTRLESTTEIPTATALDLAALDIDATWARDVWLLWARSRHRRIANVRPGQASEPIVYAAGPRVELAPELHLPGTALLALHPVGSRTTAVVTTVLDEKGRAWLRLPDGTPASVAARDVDLTDGRPLSQVTPLGGTVTGYVTGSFDKGIGPAQITLSLRKLPPTTPDIAFQSPPPVPTLDSARASYPPGTPMSATVKSIQGGRAILELPDGLPATCVTADIGATPVLDLTCVLAIGQSVTGFAASINEQRGHAQVHIKLPDLPVPTVWEQLEHLGIRSGASCTGRVTNTIDKLGVFVRLTPAIDGLIHLRTLRGRAPSTFIRNESVKVHVIAVRQDRKKTGWPAIDLRLAEPSPLVMETAVSAAENPVRHDQEISTFKDVARGFKSPETSGKMPTSQQLVQGRSPTVEAQAVGSTNVRPPVEPRGIERDDLKEHIRAVIEHLDGSPTVTECVTRLLPLWFGEWGGERYDDDFYHDPDTEFQRRWARENISPDPAIAQQISNLLDWAYDDYNDRAYIPPTWDDRFGRDVLLALKSAQLQDGLGLGPQIASSALPDTEGFRANHPQDHDQRL
ncbi:helicase-related protein [Arthrobacter sp. TE12232]